MKKLPPKNNHPFLSVIVLNYNSKNYLAECVESILNSDLNYKVEVIVADNKSTDDSFTKLCDRKSDNPNINLFFVALPHNKGFSAGNNQGLKCTNPESKYVLFLNPDTTVNPDTFQKMIEFFENNCEVDAATCHITLALTGRLQPESHRGFPTPVNTFFHFFGFGLPKLFPKSKIFNGYFAGHLDYTKTQQIEACVGAFLMVKRKVGDKIGWWNEKYFMYGEDLDLCYQLHKNGYKLFFYPGTKIVHYQGVSSGIISKTQKLTPASRQTKIRSAKATITAMRIFYDNNLLPSYHPLWRPIISLGIQLLEIYRLFKAKYL